jgi:CheY-like chemotaxis protein
MWDHVYTRRPSRAFLPLWTPHSEPFRREAVCDNTVAGTLSRRPVKRFFAVLLVTTDLGLQEAYVKALRERRQFVVTASNCEDVLRLTGEFTLNVIVFDIRTADDLSCCRLLAQRPDTRAIPLVLLLDPALTNHTIRRNGRHITLRSGCTGPCAPAHLIRVLDRVADGNRDFDCR